MLSDLQRLRSRGTEVLGWAISSYLLVQCHLRRAGLIMILLSLPSAKFRTCCQPLLSAARYCIVPSLISFNIHLVY